MSKKGKRINRATKVSLTAEEPPVQGQSTPNTIVEPPLGEAYLTKMSTEVANWTGLAADRYASLVKYTLSLEDMNCRLEARTDRSLKLAEVLFCFI